LRSEDRQPGGDPITRLQQRLDRGETTLRYDERWGYLPSLLEAFHIPVSSQTLVFSKTSAQFRLISPHSPRAIYFNDDIYVGWVRGGPILEISAADPGGGGVFYTLAQGPAEKPRFLRDTGQCLQCHESGRTLRIPGHLTRSVYPSPDGTPHFGLGTTNVDQTTPFAERYGGWYVTGSHGMPAHHGNATFNPDGSAIPLSDGSERGVTDLSRRIDVTRYLAPHSDLGAHLLLAHQTQMHNHIARAGIEARKALTYRDEMVGRFGEASKELQASVRRRIEGPSEKLLRHLLFVDEAPLEGPVEGTSSFAEEFQRGEPRGDQGRSLRDLDLQKRILRYPCSYLIYSEAFRSLPTEVKRYVYRRLAEVLTGKESSADFSHLSEADRSAIRQILADTLPEAAEYHPAFQ
jgi:hypothetical protein